MDEDRKNGAEKLNLSHPIFLERFLNLCILLALLDFFLLFLFMSTHGGWVSLDYMKCTSVLSELRINLNVESQFSFSYLCCFFLDSSLFVSLHFNF